MQHGAHAGGGRRPALVYLRQQVVNLDRIAEISVKRGRVTLCFAFARLGEPGARLVLAPAEAEPLIAALQHAGTSLPAWVAIQDRLINLDLAVDIWGNRDEITVVSALPDQEGGPLPRTFARSAAQPLLAYFAQIGTSPLDEPPAAATARPGWVPAGEHLINLALVSAIRLGSHQVHVAFAGLPRLARAFSYAEARPLLEQLQQTGVLPIDALQEDRPRDPDDAAAAAGDSTPNGGPATGRRRRFGAWLARRRG